MDTNERLNSLAHLCQGQDWFQQVGVDEFGRLIVYVKYLSLEVYQSVPNKIDNVSVLVHFASSKEASREKFVSTKNAAPFVEEIIDITDEAELLEDESPPDLRSLINELDRLEKICGSNIMQDIFYELHDGINAVTNLSVKFPEVHQGMKKLYQKYGFDIIYDELDG